jgi:hypothetical protein
LKVKVKNKTRVEGSICTAYLIEEASTFFSYNFNSHFQTRYTHIARNEEIATEQTVDEHLLSICVSRERLPGKIRTWFLTSEEFKAANNYILHNCEEVQSIISLMIYALETQELRIWKLRERLRMSLLDSSKIT